MTERLLFGEVITFSIIEDTELQKLKNKGIKILMLMQNQWVMVLRKFKLI